jgi:drug/metabolite transporter (DMT)-like permease
MENRIAQIFSHSPHWESVFWKLMSCACFAGINGVVRYLTGGSADPIADPLPVYVITFFQNFIATLCLLPFFTKDTFESLKTKYPGLHMIRVIMAVVGVFLWYLALYYMPITQAVALNFTGPIFTILGARLLLKEDIDPLRSLALLCSFTGAFFILRPDQAFFGAESLSTLYTAIFPLASAIAIVGTKLCSRFLASRGETPKVLTAYLLVFMTPVSFVPALFDWVWPQSYHWPFLVAMGVLAAAAHFCINKSYAKFDVTFTTPFGFSKILMSAAVGYFAFGEFPKTATVWIGAAIIFSSVILLSVSEQKKRKLATKRS